MDFKDIDTPKKSKGFFGFFTSGGSNETGKKSKFTVPAFEESSFELQSLTKEDWFNFFDLLKWESMLDHLGLVDQRSSRMCNLNAIEIASLMLKDLKNCHIVNFAFNYSLEYIWGDSTMGMVDLDKKYKEIENDLLGSSIVYESFILKDSNLERHSKFCVITGGMCVHLLDYENDYNK